MEENGKCVLFRLMGETHLAFPVGVGLEDRGARARLVAASLYAPILAP